MYSKRPEQPPILRYRGIFAWNRTAWAWSWKHTSS